MYAIYRGGIMMRTLEINQMEIEGLEKIKLDDRISNKEGTIYKLRNYNWRYGDNLLLKRLYITDKEVFANKLHTSSMLNDYEKEIGIRNFVIPKHFVSLQGNIIGITMEEQTDTENLGIILQDENVEMEKKIKYLSKIGDMLLKLKYLDKYDLHFYFSDLHEYNFLVGKDDEVYAVDLDSATFIDDFALPAHYLIINPNLSSIDRKYRSNVYGIPYPSHNNDVLSFNMMVLDTISQGQISHMDLNEYYGYMNHLREVGFGDDIVNSFMSVYDYKDNEVSSKYFEQIPMSNIEKATYKEYVKNKK